LESEIQHKFSPAVVNIVVEWLIIVASENGRLVSQYIKYSLYLTLLLFSSSYWLLWSSLEWWSA